MFKAHILLTGSVIDVVVDLKTGSPYFNKIKYNLEADLPSVLFVPSWCSHGFLALEEYEMYYFTSHEYDPMRDKGILWSSINFHWPIRNPILSERDLIHPSIEMSNDLFNDGEIAKPKK